MALREWVGLTERQMAAACAVTPRTYRAWERGQRKWSRGDFLAKVRTVTGVSGAWLLTGSFSREPSSAVPLAADALPLPRHRRMVVSDPGEISFLEMVRQLPPDVQDRFEALLDAIIKRKPAPVMRQAAIDYFTASGVPRGLAGLRADRLMRDLNNLRTKKLDEAC